MPVIFIVSRSHPSVYEALTERYGGEPGIAVIWDRRRGERRRAQVPVPRDRRRRDRRMRPPESWRVFGFLVIRGELPPEVRRA